MNRSIQFLCIFTCVFYIGCSGLIPVGSKDHKATILYFEGGSGKIKRIGDRGSENKLICRSVRYFSSAGIKVKYMPFNLPISASGAISRTRKDHFYTIQKKVNQLREAGHKHIWLMGISRGAISVTNAGAKQIKGVEGLIAINPGAGYYLGDFNKIALPFLLITHELNEWTTGFSENEFKRRYSNSSRPQNTIFSGGRTGTSRMATVLSQKYQHGLRGLEKEFANVVIDFITTTPESIN